MTSRALLPGTDEMRECCSLLSEEMLNWPGVRMYHLFGTCAFYHRKVMFAMLPDKRSLDGARSISFKSSAPAGEADGDNWHSFEITDGALVSDALASLEKAYQESRTHALSLPAVAMLG